MSENEDLGVKEQEPAVEPESRGASLVSVLFSAHSDVYTIPSAGTFWLSWMVHIDAMGKPCRAKYDTLQVQPGRIVAMPADDPLVVDYMKEVEAAR